MSGTPKEVRATESQAIARAHRRGQEKVITIVRFLVNDTIELFNYMKTYGKSKLIGILLYCYFIVFFKIFKQFYFLIESYN